MTSPTYWAVRNLLFEVFFFLGVFLLSRVKGYPWRWPLVGYSLVVSLPLLFIEGTPVYSIPRLLLAGFPIFIEYSENVFVRRWTLLLYGVVPSSWRAGYSYPSRSRSSLEKGLAHLKKIGSPFVASTTLESDMGANRSGHSVWMGMTRPAPMFATSSWTFLIGA